jgi:hypothetical protein
MTTFLDTEMKADAEPVASPFRAGLRRRWQAILPAAAGSMSTA